MSQTVAEKMRQARADVGMTLEAVADVTGLNISTLHRSELGLTTPRRVTVAAVAKVYGRSVDWFFGEDEEDKPKGIREWRTPYNPESTVEMNLSFEERDLVLGFRRLPRPFQDTIQATIETLLRHATR